MNRTYSNKHEIVLNYNESNRYVKRKHSGNSELKINIGNKEAYMIIHHSSSCTYHYGMCIIMNHHVLCRYIAFADKPINSIVMFPKLLLLSILRLYYYNTSFIWINRIRYNHRPSHSAIITFNDRVLFLVWILPILSDSILECISLFVRYQQFII